MKVKSTYYNDILTLRSTPHANKMTLNMEHESMEFDRANVIAVNVFCTSGLIQNSGTTF